MTMILECRSFTATPLEEGKVRLEITGAVTKDRKPDQTYSAEGAMARLGELLSRKVSRSNLSYWRENLGRPYRTIGPRKLLYTESELVRWAKGKGLL